MTCSFGVAEWHRGEDLNDGIKRADEAMYRAKQEGRDRVEIELDTTAVGARVAAGLMARAQASLRPARPERAAIVRPRPDAATGAAARERGRPAPAVL